MIALVQELPKLVNGGAIPLIDIPFFDFKTFRETILANVGPNARLAALFGQPIPDGGLRLFAILANHEEGLLSPFATDLHENSFPSLTPDCPSAHNFEREIAEQWGVVPLGHPWLKPLRYHPSYRPGHDAWNRTIGAPILPAVTDYFQVTGPEIHEVAVGPVHGARPSASRA